MILTCPYCWALCETRSPGSLLHVALCESLNSRETDIVLAFEDQYQCRGRWQQLSALYITIESQLGLYCVKMRGRDG